MLSSLLEFIAIVQQWITVEQENHNLMDCWLVSEIHRYLCEFQISFKLMRDVARVAEIPLHGRTRRIYPATNSIRILLSLHHGGLSWPIISQYSVIPQLFFLLVKRSATPETQLVIGYVSPSLTSQENTTRFDFQPRTTAYKFHQPRLVIRTFHRLGHCSRGGHLCNEHSEEKYSCSYK